MSKTETGAPPKAGTGTLELKDNRTGKDYTLQVTEEGVEGDTYRARKPVFATIYDNDGSGAAPGASVQVLDVIQSDEPLRRMHQPDHPLANEDGDIYLPNVNPVAEMTDMMSASRAFETSVEVLTRTRQMQMAVLRLGES